MIVDMSVIVIRRAAHTLIFAEKLGQHDIPSQTWPFIRLRIDPL